MNIRFTFTERDTEDYEKWISFYPKVDNQTPFRLQLEKWGYFDPRPQLNFNITSVLAAVLPFFSLWLIPLSFIFLFFGWGKVFLKLPFDSGMGDECDSPQYGLNTYKTGSNAVADEVWFYWGKKREHKNLPWALNWYRTSVLLKDGSWETEKKGDKKNFYEDEWKQRQWSEQYEYTYTLRSGEVQKLPTTIYVEEREWRRQGWMWCSLFNSVNKKIDVDFTEEVGEGRGSWKGGVLGCGYSIKKGETPLECLKRMEQERKFDR